MANAFKTYPAPWAGEIVLACRKCQKKLRRDCARGELAKLKKTIRSFNKVHPDRLLHVINVPCMDLCPKDGVTVCCPERASSRLQILRNLEDIRRLEGAESIPAKLP